MSVKKITAEQAKEIIDSGTRCAVADVREPEEYEEGHIENAVLLPLGDIMREAERILPDKNLPVLVYCRSGMRSAEAAKKLNLLGYKNIIDFGGILDWEYEVVV